jgi:hypothetical protein
VAAVVVVVVVAATKAVGRKRGHGRPAWPVLRPAICDVRCGAPMALRLRHCWLLEELSLKGKIAIATKHLSASTASSKKQQQATIKQRTSALSPKNGDIGYIY